jgi:hypothetical protein
MRTRYAIELPDKYETMCIQFIHLSAFPFSLRHDQGKTNRSLTVLNTQSVKI